jgi:hypothetical protein
MLNAWAASESGSRSLWRLGALVRAVAAACARRCAFRDRDLAAAVAVFANGGHCGRVDRLRVSSSRGA